MPSGSLTLLEASKFSTNTLKSGVIETLIQESPILEMLPFVPIAGNAIEITVEGNLPSPQYRAVNETYTTSWAADTKRFFGVTILGGEVKVDNFIQKVASNKVNAKARQFAKFAKAMSRTFDKSFFDGLGTEAAKDFKGLNALITQDGLGQTLSMGTNGAALTLDKLDEAFDMLRSQSNPDAILLNRFTRRKITALARSTYTGVSLIDVGTDVFGKQVFMYNGVPLRIIGDDITGTAILGFDETEGSSNVAASLYIIAFGEEENVCGLAGAGGSMDVVDFGETQAAPAHLGRIEWYPGLAVYNPYSLVRLTGILQS